MHSIDRRKVERSVKCCFADLHYGAACGGVWKGVVSVGTKFGELVASLGGIGFSGHGLHVVVFCDCGIGF